MEKHLPEIIQDVINLNCQVFQLDQLIQFQQEIINDLLKRVENIEFNAKKVKE